MLNTHLCRLNSNHLLYFFLSILLSLSSILIAQDSDESTLDRPDGFFKAVLADGGPGVNSTPSIHFTEMGLSYDILGGNYCDLDIYDWQTKFIGSDMDTNGILLYPDGAPRYQLLTIGGAADDTMTDGCVTFYNYYDIYNPNHPNHVDNGCPEQNPPGGECQEIYEGWVGGGGRHFSVMQDSYGFFQSGYENVHQYYNNGGSFSGFCAGAAITDYGSLSLWNGSLELLPGQGRDDLYIVGSILDPYTNNLSTISQVQHLGGYYLNLDHNHPEGTEVLAESWVFPGIRGGAVWAYKPTEQSGRLVVSGHHPEKETFNPQAVELTTAMYRYAIAGNGGPVLKADLMHGVPQRMYSETEENSPLTTKIGDRQYHHFRIDIPADHPFLRIRLVHEEGFQLNLYLREGAYAMGEPYILEQSENHQTHEGRPADEVEKVYYIDNVDKGEYYIGVECATIPTGSFQHGVNWTDNLEVLNGVGYTLTAEWQSSPFCGNGLSQVTRHGSAPTPGSIQEVRYQVDCNFPSTDRALISLVNVSTQETRPFQTPGSMQWGTNTVNVQLPEDLSAGDYVFRVQNDNDTNAFAESQAFTLIVPGFSDLSLSHPQIPMGQNLTITWQANIAFPSETTTIIDLLNEDSSLIRNLATVGPSQAGSNSFTWTANQALGAYRIRVHSETSPTAPIESDVFDITEAPGFYDVRFETLDGPNILDHGDPFRVSYRVSGLSYGLARIELFELANHQLKQVLSTNGLIIEGTITREYTLDLFKFTSRFQPGLHYVRISHPAIGNATSPPLNLFGYPRINGFNFEQSVLYEGQFARLEYQIPLDYNTGQGNARAYYEDKSLLVRMNGLLPLTQGSHSSQQPITGYQPGNYYWQVQHPVSHDVLATTSVFEVRHPELEMMDPSLDGAPGAQKINISWRWQGEANVKAAVRLYRDGQLNIEHQTLLSSQIQNVLFFVGSIQKGQTLKVEIETLNRHVNPIESSTLEF